MQRTAFMTVVEVAQTLGISKSHAYKIVHRLNQELKDKGFITIAGRINRRYFIMVPWNRTTNDNLMVNMV